MGRVRDSSVTRDASFLARSCGGVCVAHQMVRQLAQDVDSAEEVELRRLELHPEACRAVAELAAARLVADGEPVRDGLRTAQAWPVAGSRDADAGSPPPWPTREVFAPRADAAVVPGPGSGSRCDVVRPGSTVPVDGDGVSSRRPFKKTKRMDRRLSHWQCTFCRHENPLSEQAEVCGKCNGARQQLGDSDAVAREEARRSARSREAHGRALNSRGVGCETVPRLTPGIFEQARYDALVAWEVNELERYAGAASYLVKEECNIGIISLRAHITTEYCVRIRNSQI